MGNAIIKILIGLVGKLLTQQFFARIIIYGFWWLASKTKMELDDKIVEDMAKSLGVENYKGIIN